MKIANNGFLHYYILHQDALLSQEVHMIILDTLMSFTMDQQVQFHFGLYQLHLFNSFLWDS